MNRKAFTLVELAIVITIIGVLVGGSFKVLKSMRDRNKMTEAKEYVNIAKDTTIGYSMEWIDLPTQTEFNDDLSPTKGTNEGDIFYFADPQLANDDDICSFNSTDLDVTIYDSGTITRTIDNIAFVVAARSVNYNMQTGVKEPGSSSPYEVRIDDPGATVDRNSSDFVRTSDEYDDIVKWVTLSELQQHARCSDKPLRIVNDKLPDTDTTLLYNATIVLDGNYTPPTSNNCTSSESSFSYNNVTHIISLSSPRATGTAVVNCTFTADGRTVSKPFVITINPSSTTPGTTPGTKPKKPKK